MNQRARGSTGGGDIVIVTRGSYGDVVPFLALGVALRARGHAVTLVTHCHYEADARRTGLAFASWDSPDEFARFIADGPLLDRPSSVARFAEAHVLPYTAAEYRLITERAAHPRTVIVARHMGSMAAWFAAERLRAPLAIVFTAVAQANCWPLFRYLCESRLRDALNDSRRAVGLGDVGSWSDFWLLPSLFLGCWPASFAEPTPDWPGGVLPLGFITCDDVEDGLLPDQLERWLASGPPPVLITGGTARWTLAERFYRTAARACAVAGRRAIVVCPHDDIVPTHEEVSAVWFRRLPFASLMERVAAVIHHGGTSVQVRAMKSRIPQLTMPFGGDRIDTASRLAATGAAACIPPPLWNPEHVAERLRTLLESDEVRTACERLAMLEASDASLAAGCDAIEQAIG